MLLILMFAIVCTVMESPEILEAKYLRALKYLSIENRMKIYVLVLTALALYTCSILYYCFYT